MSDKIINTNGESPRCYIEGEVKIDLNKLQKSKQAKAKAMQDQKIIRK